MLCAVIGLLAVLLLAVLVFWCVRRQRNGYSPKDVTEEKKPLNEITQIMRLNGPGMHADTMAMEKTAFAGQNV